MKKSKKLFAFILCLGILLASSANCYAATGTVSTPTGKLCGYDVKGTLTVEQKQLSAFIGFTGSSPYYGYWTVTIYASYVNNTTGVEGRQVYTYTTAAPYLNLKWAVPTNCSFTGATANFSGTCNGNNWHEFLSI